MKDEETAVSTAKHITKIAADAGCVPVEIVSILDKAILPASTTRLELKRCEDGTFLLATVKPAAAPVGVGFRLTATNLIALRELLRTALDVP